MIRPTYEDLEKTIVELREVIFQQQKIIAKQQKTIAGLHSEINDLKLRLSKNSSNSSKPPSSDQKKNSPKRDAIKHGKPYHPGVSRELLPDHMVTSHESRKLELCPRCSSKMTPTGKSQKWQQIELPQITPLVHQIELFQCKCTHCGLVNTPDLEDHENYLMGPRLEGFVNLLMIQFRNSHLAVRSFINLLIPGLKLSQGLISKVKKRGAKAFEEAADQLTQEILAFQGPKYVDTTGWRHEGQNWNTLIVRTSNLIRYFFLEKQNGDYLAGVLKGGPHYLVSDRGLATQKLECCHLQYCLAHLLRNIKGIAEHSELRLEEVQSLGEIHESLQELFHDRHRYERGEISYTTYRQYSYQKLAWIREEIEDIQERCTSKKLRRFCRRVSQDWKNFMVYLAQDGPMTNNLAEEGLRNLVIARKLCFGSQSMYGLQWREATLSCVETLKRQCRSIMDFFEETIRAHRMGTLLPGIV